MADANLHPKLISRQQAKQQGSTRYFTGKPCKNGHVMQRLVSNGRCSGCLQDWKKNNRGSVNRAQQRHRKIHAERWKELGRKYYWQNPEKHREASREAARKKAAAKPKLIRKYPTPIMKDLANRMRCRMWCALKTGKGKPLEAVLGYTVEDLQRHLERQFTKGMTWENRGRWHIDHIVPVASFNFSSYDDPEFKACWALSNLRPLWKEDNRRKWFKREHLL